MSDMPGLLFSMRDGNGGVMPLSSVKIDSKYWLSRLALSTSEVTRMLELFLSGGTLEWLRVLLFGYKSSSIKNYIRGINA